MKSEKPNFKTALGYDQKIISGYKYQIAIQAKVLQSIQQALPKELATHVLYCTISDRKISLYTDSATWSSQLRFYQQAIIKAAIDSEQGSFDTFQAKVIPQVKETVVKKKTIIPSEENIGLLLNQAEYQSDDELKNSLIRLGNTLKKCHHKKTP